jgi:hypothetical protein
MKKTSSFLTGFLAMLVAAGLFSSADTAQAAIVNINIGPSGFNIGGTNAGVPLGSSNSVSGFPFSGGSTLYLWNDSADYIGLSAGAGLFFFLSDTTPASPKNFASNDLISAASGSFAADAQLTSFYDAGFSATSPDFGPNSYLGFFVQDSATSFYHYGWLEVTWDGASQDFQILSGAYESDPGVGILAGAGPSAAVPEPGTWAAAALLASGAAFMRWRKRAKVA